MSKKIPITSAKEIAQKFGYSQVIITAWDGEDSITNVVTYGKTEKDCEQAAIGGDFIKKALGWPENQTNTAPYRAKQKSTFMQVEIIKKFINRVFKPTGYKTKTKFEMLVEVKKLEKELENS